ncbi:MAG: preprotein translocase subunit SecG [Candidatus Peribacteraceae bacterium]|nr:preprotein translocase subunit SecG [Candidatus Peribacteraceae bacterium]
MLLKSLVTIILVIVSLLLSLTILLQHRASGLSATFGGSGATYVQRRGAEKVIYVASIWLSAIFFGLSVLLWYL